MAKAGRVGDNAFCPVDSHGCVTCTHSVTGPAVGGSPDVFINGKPALRVGDPGIHSACCGANQWKAASGSSGVFINGRPAHRMGDMTQHCGGVGKLREGSPNVDIGEKGGSTHHTHVKPEPKDECPPPPWMPIVISQMGTQRYCRVIKDRRGIKHKHCRPHKHGNNPKIMAYHKTVFPKLHGISEQTPWCGSFANWVMNKYRGTKHVRYVPNPARALDWTKFGKRCSKPVYGAIGVKTRHGGGHVSFVMGVSPDGKYIYMLGGNQTAASKVVVEKYPIRVWNRGFYVPKDYDCSKCKVRIYRGTASTGKDLN